MNKKWMIAISTIFVILLGVSILWLLVQRENVKPDAIVRGSQVTGKLEVELEKLPKEYTQDQAIKDGCLVITNSGQIYNSSKLDTFMENTSINNVKRKEDSIKIVQFTVEGDSIITEVSLEGENYCLKKDNTRDKFAAKEDRKITVEEDIPAKDYMVMKIEKEDKIEVILALCSFISYASEDSKIYEDIVICSYLKDAQIVEKYPSFFGKVIESKEKYILVEVKEGEEVKKSSDKFYIDLGEDNDVIYQVGTNVKITYTGMIRETYPAQIDVIRIELKSLEAKD